MFLSKLFRLTSSGDMRPFVIWHNWMMNNNNNKVENRGSKYLKYLDGLMVQIRLIQWHQVQVVDFPLQLERTSTRVVKLLKFQAKVPILQVGLLFWMQLRPLPTFFRSLLGGCFFSKRKPTQKWAKKSGQRSLHSKKKYYL